MFDSISSRPRYAFVDLARGGAIAAMVFYHFVWDLSYYRLIAYDITLDPWWTLFARAILTAFLLLAGFGLVLAHGEGMRWRAFWKREAMIAGAAVMVSIGTYFAFGPALAFFGVLHAIAFFSLIAIPFLRAPIWLTLAGALVFIIPPRLVRFEAFNEPWLAWIGFWTDAPPSADLVPVFPWAGVLLLGVVAGRVFLASDMRAKAAANEPTSRIWRGLARAGRWSLIIYVLHQPLLHAALYPISELTKSEPGLVPVEFIEACETSCVSGNGEAGFCQSYCACALDQVQSNALIDFTANGPLNLDEGSDLAQMATLCTAMAGEQNP